jgi:cytidyltransferase-like protein
MNVAISGYFDPIHKGHVEYMKLAKEYAGPNGRLIVILNNDQQAVLKKGRPFMTCAERQIIVEAIRYVDEVVISIDQDPSVCQTLATLENVSYFIKGGDRYSYEIPEAAICKEKGIQILDGFGDKIQSSSALTGLKQI